MIIYVSGVRLKASRYAGCYSQNTPECAKKRRSSFAASKFLMMNNEMAVNDEMLNSWKEVAAYLGRGVRTVQRWELDLGLPVRRPRGKPRSAIIALKPELDQWLTSSKVPLAKETSIKKPPTLTPKTQSLHSNTELLMSRTKQILERSVALCTQSRHLSEQLNRVLILTAKLAMSRSEKKPLTPPPVIIQHTKANETTY